MKITKILNMPELRQTFSFDCGASALQSVMVYYGIEEKESNLFKKLETNEHDFNSVGAKMYKIVEVAQSYGLQAKLRDDGNIQMIIDYIDKNIPVIMLIQAWKYDDKIEWKNDFEHGHYVVAIGYSDDKIIFEDPADFHRNFIYKKDLMDRWHAYDDDDKLSYKHYAIIITGTPKYKKNQMSMMERLEKLIDNKIRLVLSETPHAIHVRQTKLSFGDSDALAVVYINCKAYVGDYKSVHIEIPDDDIDFNADFGDSPISYPSLEGRLWKTNRTLSFWEAPKPNQMVQFIKALNATLKRRNFNIKVDLNWYIDVTAEKKDINGNTIQTEDLITLKDYIKQDFLSSKIFPNFGRHESDSVASKNKSKK